MFENALNFIKTYDILLQKNVQGEMFVSHIISYMLTCNNTIFTLITADIFEDWGTLAEWQQSQKKHRTYFVDVDGIILKNSGKYGLVNWQNNKILL